MNFNDQLESIFEGFAKNIKFWFFCFLLCMIYIMNNNLAQKLMTDINYKAIELKELRWDYLTIKSDLMYKTKLNEVLPRANQLELVPLKDEDIPFKIILKPKDYQRQD